MPTKIIGNRFSSSAHELRDFMSRNHLDATWLDFEQDAEAQNIIKMLRLDSGKLPVVVLEDFTIMVQPSVTALAYALGVSAQPQRDEYDLVVVGAGPAGLAAAVGAASEGLRTIVLEREAPGGQAGTSSRIENYLGFPEGIPGLDLALRGCTQAQRLGAEVLTVEEVIGLEVDGTDRVIKLTGDRKVKGKCVLLAMGVNYRQIDLPGFGELAGQGVYYGAALTEARLCTDQNVIVVGGANSAGQAAVCFSGYAKKVTMLVRSNLQKSMSQYLIDQILNTPNIEVKEGYVPKEAQTDSQGRLVAVQAAKAYDTAVTDQTLSAESCFVFIGAHPRTDWLEGVVERDSHGFVLSGREAVLPHGIHQPDHLETSIPGVFVAGDVRAGSTKRVASACGEGAMAIPFVHAYLAEQA